MNIVSHLVANEPGIFLRNWWSLKTELKERECGPGWQKHNKLMVRSNQAAPLYRPLPAQKDDVM